MAANVSGFAKVGNWDSRCSLGRNFILSRPNYKTSLELLKLIGFIHHPNLRKADCCAFVLLSVLLFCNRYDLFSHLQCLQHFFLFVIVIIKGQAKFGNFFLPVVQEVHTFYFQFNIFLSCSERNKVFLAYWAINNVAINYESSSYNFGTAFNIECRFWFHLNKKLSGKLTSILVMRDWS